MEEKKSNSGLIVLIVMLIIFILGLGGFIGYTLLNRNVLSNNNNINNYNICRFNVEKDDNYLVKNVDVMNNYIVYEKQTNDEEIVSEIYSLDCEKLYELNYPVEIIKGKDNNIYLMRKVNAHEGLQITELYNLSNNMEKVFEDNNTDNIIEPILNENNNTLIGLRYSNSEYDKYIDLEGNIFDLKDKIITNEDEFTIGNPVINNNNSVIVVNDFNENYYLLNLNDYSYSNSYKEIIKLSSGYIVEKNNKTLYIDNNEQIIDELDNMYDNFCSKELCVFGKSNKLSLYNGNKLISENFANYNNSNINVSEIYYNGNYYIVSLYDDSDLNKLTIYVIDNDGNIKNTYKNIYGMGYNESSKKTVLYEKDNNKITIYNTNFDVDKTYNVDNKINKVGSILNENNKDYLYVYNGNTNYLDLDTGKIYNEDEKKQQTVSFENITIEYNKDNKKYSIKNKDKIISEEENYGYYNKIDDNIWYYLGENFNKGDIIFISNYKK